MKKCSKCQLEKEEKEFQKQSKSKDGLRSMCSPCKQAARREYYQQNKAKELQSNKQWIDKNIEKVRAFRLKHSRKPERKAYQKQYRKEHRRERADYQTKLERENLSYRIASRLRHRLYMALKAQKTSKTYSAMKLLGCDIGIFKLYIISKFEPDMSWNNYGQWHIDHIIPCASFNLENLEEQKQCFHYTNLQPLWAFDNLTKNKKIIIPSSYGEAGNILD